jgi:hypothetical protein
MTAESAALTAIWTLPVQSRGHPVHGCHGECDGGQGWPMEGTSQLIVTSVTG